MGGNTITSAEISGPVTRLPEAGDDDDEPSARALLETVQRALLPHELPVVPGISIDARYLPASSGLSFAGDWYDACRMPDGRLFLAAGDVVGRGAAAASAMGRMRGALQAYALDGASPRSMLERLNRQTDDLGIDDVASIVLVVLDPTTGRAEIANAGHPPPAVRDADGNVSFAGGRSGPPIGATSRAHFHQSVFVLDAGSTLVLYTDGLVEQRGEPLDAGLGRLADALARGPRTTAALVEHLVGVLDPSGLHDDVALLVVGMEAPMLALHLEFPAALRALRPMRHSLTQWLARVGIDHDAQTAIVVAVNEAVANAVEHAYSPADGDVRVDADVRPGNIEVVVRDHGTWREIPRGKGGLGLQLMRHLMDDVDVRTGPDGTEITLRLRVTMEAGAAL